MITKLRRFILPIFLLSVTATSCWAGEHQVAHGIEEMSMTHRMMMLALQLGTILFVAKFGSGLFQKFHLPGVLGELGIGIIVGPYLLGAIALPGLAGGLFPVCGEFPISPELYGFCSIAAIVLLFNAGLETDVELFMRYSIVGGLVGIGGVLLSFVMGDLTAVWFSHLLFDEPVNFFSPAALFLGVMSTATSVGITARILSEKHKIDSPEGVTILAGAVIDDVLGIILLAVTMGVISASKATGSVDWAHIGLISAKAVGIWLVATVTGLVASHKISILLKLFKNSQTIAIMALGLGLVLAGLFEEAGLAMIIGAYVMGLSLARTDICHLVREKLEPISAFLIPIFFVVMGMLVNIRLLASPAVLAFGAIYTVLAIFSKVIGCATPAICCGFNTRGSLRIGVGMLPRGEVALIVAGIGLAAGIVSQEIFSVGVLMTLATTVVAPPILIGLFKSDKPGLRHAAPVSSEKPMRFSLPSLDAVELLITRIFEVFEDDGFFVHTLDRVAGIYQMRKNATIVTLRSEEKDVIFNCRESDKFFIYTAVLEVVSDLRCLAAELAKPIDRMGLSGESLKIHGENVAMVSLGAHIDPAVLSPNLVGETKEDIIKELIRLVAKSGLVGDLDKVCADVMAREQSGSTGMQHGIALPHAKTKQVEQLVCAIGIKPEGMDFDSLDHELAKIFVLVLSPVDVTGPHIRFLAMISQILSENEERERLLKCRTSDEMYRLLSKPLNG